LAGGKSLMIDLFLNGRWKIVDLWWKIDLWLMIDYGGRLISGG